MVFTDYVHKMRSSPHSTTVLSVLPHVIKGRRTPSATLKQMPRFMKLGLVVIVCALCISLFSQSVAPSFLKQGEATSPFPASGQGFTYKERFRGLILGAPTGPGTPDYLEYDRIITGYVESVAGTTITYRENWQIENIIPRIQYFHMYDLLELLHHTAQIHQYHHPRTLQLKHPEGPQDNHH